MTETQKKVQHLGEAINDYLRSNDPHPLTFTEGEHGILQIVQGTTSPLIDGNGEIYGAQNQPTPSCVH